MFAETEHPFLDLLQVIQLHRNDEAAIRPIFKLLAGMPFSPTQHLPALGDSGFQGDG
jgi:hypothetical protein